jgi:putative DNA methylase
MTYRKKLIEVALPLEAINMESAREKSIRHGHPSTLHLWWARRPLAACRAVLWSSLVDDPSSWPDKFPTEEAQNQERQRLFNILGRIVVETDKKGNTKQVVKGLVSWDEVNDPNSKVLENAQREIARCLAWDRGEEPPTKPDAVREYIAKYAPPVYDPFAGGGSIPLEAQRLGLEAHASDLNPVAVLINKALIEIPPKFKDQAPVNPVDRAKDGRGQGTGNRGEWHERGAVASGFSRLAEVDGSSGAGLSLERSLSEGGDVSFNQSDHASSGVGASEYCGGERTGNSQGLRQFSGDRQGGADGNRNVSDVGSASQLSNPAGSQSNSGTNRGNQQNANCPSQASTSALNPPVTRSLFPISYKGAQGLAADVRYYGAWMRDEAFKRIGHLYPRVMVGNREEGTGNREEGTGNSGEPAPSSLPPVTCHLSPVTYTVIAWLWARTVKCPNPACGCQMPLVRSFQLSTKKGKEAWVEPVVDRTQTPPKIQFEVKTGKGKAPEGTVERKGARCIACETPVPFDHVRNEGKAGRMGQQLMAIVAEGKGGRVYLAPSEEQEDIANSAQPQWKPDTDLPKEALGFRVQNYGMTKHADLFTARQLVALTTFSDLVGEAREKATQDAIAAGLPDDDVPLNDGGIGARAYGEAIATYLGFGVSKSVDYWSNICTWRSDSKNLGVGHVFSRQAIPMVWDFAEGNTFSDSSGNWTKNLEWVTGVLEKIPCSSSAKVNQLNATSIETNHRKIISVDPPYYDNIGYADLADFFYVWLRRSFQSIYADLFSTLLVPKTEELVATPYRFDGSKQKAQEFFEIGLGKAFERMHEISHANYPLTVYYAFKQAETDQKGKSDESVSSTGWETMLEGLIKADFSIGGTWPMRSELSNRMIASGTNALASSIVLVCRPRPTDAPKITRRQFLTELKRELPRALKTLQQGNVAPVDLAQASIGPGMAIYSQYAAVLENDGSPMRVRTALQLINQILDEFLTEQEGEFDSDTRWALTWFEQHQFEPGQYGDAETLSKAKNTSVTGMVEAGILEAKAGKVRLLSREEIGSRKQGRGKSDDSVPSFLSSVPSSPDWLITQTLIHTLDTQGETGAAEVLAKLGERGEMARDLAYRLYRLCDRKGWTQEALAYNSLVISWPEITRLASEVKTRDPIQTSLL